MRNVAHRLLHGRQYREDCALARPFRWSFDKREQLGSWIDLATGWKPPLREDVDTLRETCARILAMSDGADLAFIGRSPENLYDYLCGCFSGLEGMPDLSLVPFSMRWLGASGVDGIEPHKLAGLREALQSSGLSPARIAAAERPVALVDMVAYGGTMESLVRILHRLAQQDGTDWKAVQRRLKIIGIRTRTKNSPNTWRWQQNQTWLDLIPDAVIKNVSAHAGFVFLIANTEEKVTNAFHYGRWDEGNEGAPKPDGEQLRAMKQAAWLYDRGATRAERHALSALIAKRPEMKQAATRALVLRLRRG